MTDFLFGPFLVWAPRLLAGVLFLLATVWYFSKNSGRLWWTAVSTAFLRVSYALLETVAQKHAFFSNSLGQYLLPPHQPASYWLWYSWGRFWIGGVLLSLGAAYLFYWFLKSLRVYRARFFDVGEVELGLLTALLVGWPRFVLFVAATFLLVLLLSGIRLGLPGGRYTTLGVPMLVACLLTLVWGDYFIQFFHLRVLQI